MQHKMKVKEVGVQKRAPPGSTASALDAPTQFNSHLNSHFYAEPAGRRGAHCAVSVNSRGLR